MKQIALIDAEPDPSKDIGLLLNRDRGAEVSRYDYYLSPKPKRKRAEQRLAASSGDGASQPASPSGRRA